MTRIHIITVLTLILLSTGLRAEGDKVRFAYDVDFEMRFDNREYYRSAFSPSMTIFGARLTPSVGLDIYQDRGVSHRLMMGIDVSKDFGASPVSKLLSGGTDIPETSQKQNNADLFREMTLYYKLHTDTGKSGLELYAGIFPRRAMMGDYSDAFFSDSLRFYDNNIEGILLRIRNQKTLWELGCDWMGQFGQVRKEKFMVFLMVRQM